MVKRIEVRSQVEFDACVKDGNIAIVIGCSVVAWGNSSVVARENSSVVARENSSVEAWGNVFLRLFSAIFIKVSINVVIIKHEHAPSFEGGQQINAAIEPKMGSEWCEFNGIDPNVPYKVAGIDKAILELIEKSPNKFDMGSWHGSDCNNDNWCNTTHCRAGYAICLAGEEGFKLEKKYGAELAGRMIYAVSRPNKELPNFFANTQESMEDIKKCAEERDEN